MDTIKRIENWFDVATPNPTAKNFYLQTAYNLEEWSEVIEAIGGKESELFKTLLVAKSELIRDANNTSDEETNEAFNECVNKTLLADGIADSIVTLVGMAKMAGIDIFGALKEVAQSNESKYYYAGVGDLSDHEWEDLNAICKEIEAQGRYKGVGWQRHGEWIVFKDGNGKIMKNPRTYREPELSGFIGGK
ncbi:MazG [Rheinheimera phage vB_RspM_Barba19A]|uniref:MazG n=2 Tax=Barbavirus barba19A TaxID=2734091 RepID=A0A4P8NF21_9CAUD|nr:MazG [Rheinheimera phage vB_RspM_Barba19A]QCQ61847.1 MazG [Rheinheimera phage vB_RspM_Barba19A]QCQ64597.1 MazG [Rheinheimera phage vB_RspM_Barba31A]